MPGGLLTIFRDCGDAVHITQDVFEVQRSEALRPQPVTDGAVSDCNKATALEIQEQRSRIDGILTPVEIAKIRRHLNLNQKDASRIFGGGINAFNRYERGTNPIPKPLSMLLLLLDKHPEQLQELLMPHQSDYRIRSI